MNMEYVSGIMDDEKRLFIFNQINIILIYNRYYKENEIVARKVE